MKGLVTRKNADRFDVRVGEQVFSCIARGNLKKEGIFVGDKVVFNKKDMVIEQILARKNVLIRPPLANLDRMIITIAEKPSPDLYLVDKLIVFCFLNGIKPILCVNKVDECKDFYEKIKKIYSKVLPIVKASAKENDVEEVLKHIKGITCFAGQSAVGKSSMINSIFGKNLEKIGDFAKKVERGKQTTRTVSLYRLSNSNFIADTAGFSKLDEELLNLEQNEIARYYPDMIKFIEKCKFRTCLHKNSKDCAIIKAVENGEIAKERYENYLKLLEAKRR